MRVIGRHYLSLAVLVFVAIPITSLASQAPPLNFAKPRPYKWVGEEDWVFSVAVADLNGDGHLDMVATLSYSGKIAVLLGKGDGSFRRVVKYSPGGSNPGSVAIADVNGDRKPDILVLDDSGLGVLLGNGDGSFQPPVTYGVYAEVWNGPALAVGDLNRDGYPDVAVASGLCSYWSWQEMDSCVNVLYNNGDGTFSPPFEEDTGGYGVSLAVAIVNGSLIATANCLDRRCDWMWGTVCIDRWCHHSGGDAPIALATGDLNGDGYFDIVVANSGQIWGDSSVGVFLRDSQGTFRRVLYGYGAEPWSVAIGDMNGDGKPDIVVDGGVLLGKGPGVSFGWVGYNLVLGDLNGDGKLDVIGTEGTMLNISGFDTTTQITSSLNPSFVNQSVTFTATVTSNDRLIPDGELVKFYAGSKLLASVPLSGRTATYTTSTLTAETHIIKAKYAGDTRLAPSAGQIKQLVQ
ncbi:MAG TPA: FG-GAP-like repeat-containing protein [Terriglobales bacterium]|nr:FG-GAP-like repeat-containing protein [Terriglobales bacterium]